MFVRPGSYLILLVLLVTGCSKTSFLGKRLDNFTAYYNTFYNAKKLYRSGVDALERASDSEIDRNRYLPIFATPDRVSNQQNFNDAIKKSADVLRESPGSKWVDDALMLIGKSYFYLQNYVGSEQKFVEVINLGGDLEDEARFWLARTFIASGSLEQAEDHLEVSLNREDLSSSWEPMLRMALGELYVRQEAWAESAVELEQALDRVKDKSLAARAQFLLAQVYETMAEHEKAIAAYSRVPRYKPEYPLIYAALVSQIRTETQYGDPEQALKLLRGMERDDKNYDNRAELSYFKGRTYQALGESDQAYTTYYDLLYNDDRTLNINEVRGRIHYALGELNRDVYIDFPYAAAHFDTSRAALSASNRSTGVQAAQEQFAPEAIIDSERQADVLGSFAEVYEELTRLDSLLWLGDMDEETFSEYILELRKERAKELAEQQRELAKREAEQRFANSAARTQVGPRKVIDGPESGQPNADQGFLYHKDRLRLQEGRQNFLVIWGNRPRVPNWRRLEAIQNASVEESPADDVQVVSDLRDAELSEDFLPEIDYSDVPRDSASTLTMEEERALIRYELGNVLFLSMERPDSAAAWYRMVIDESNDFPVSQRAYYALSEVQRALGDQESAERLYREVLEKYPDSEFADQVRERLGLPAFEKPQSDSLQLAEEAYREAYSLWEEENYQDAITNMVLLASNYRLPDVAPRALAATGTIYMEWAARDQMDVYALPLPAVPDSLLYEQGLVDSTIFYAATPKADIEQALSDSLVVSVDSLQQSVEANFTEVVETVDSVKAVADSAAVAADSVAASPDSTITFPDSVAASPDSTITFPDSVAASPDSTLASPDSVLLAPLTGSDEGKRSAEEHTDRLQLDRLFTTIKERYPQSEYAAYADRMLKALVDLRPAGDSLLERPVAEAEPEDDSVDEASDSLSVEDLYILGDEAIDVDGVGWTLIVGSFEIEEEAEASKQEYAAMGLKSGIIQVGERFRVGVGQFPGLDEARAGLAKYKDVLPQLTWFLDIEKPR